MHLYSPSTSKRILAALLLFSHSLMSCSSLYVGPQLKLTEHKSNQPAYKVQESLQELEELNEKEKNLSYIEEIVEEKSLVKGPEQVLPESKEAYSQELALEVSKQASDHQPVIALPIDQQAIDATKDTTSKQLYSISSTLPTISPNQPSNTKTSLNPSSITPKNKKKPFVSVKESQALVNAQQAAQQSRLLQEPSSQFKMSEQEVVNSLTVPSSNGHQVTLIQKEDGSWVAQIQDTQFVGFNRKLVLPVAGQRELLDLNKLRSHEDNWYRYHVYVTLPEKDLQTGQGYVYVGHLGLLGGGKACKTCNIEKDTLGECGYCLKCCKKPGERGHAQLPNKPSPKTAQPSTKPSSSYTSPRHQTQSHNHPSMAFRSISELEESVNYSLARIAASERREKMEREQAEIEKQQALIRLREKMIEDEIDELRRYKERNKSFILESYGKPGERKPSSLEEAQHWKEDIEQAILNIEASDRRLCELGVGLIWNPYELYQLYEVADAQESYFKAEPERERERDADQGLGSNSGKAGEEKEEEAFLRAVETGSLAEVKRLIHLEPRCGTNGYTALHLAVEKGHLPIVQYLIEVVKVDAEAAEWNKNKRPIHMATEKGHLHIVQYLIEKAAVDKEAVARNQSRPIHLAIRKGHLAIADYLIRKARVNAEAAYKYGDTPIHLAVEYGYLPLVQCLIEEAKAKQEVTDSWGYRPLHKAVLHNRLDIVRYLIENVKVDKEAETENKDRPIHLAVVNGNLSMLQYLIEKAKVEAQACNLYRYTPLHYAARDGHLALVQYLIERAQVDPTSLNHKGETPLDLAVKQNHQEVIAYLEETTEFSARVLTVENAATIIAQYLRKLKVANNPATQKERGMEVLKQVKQLKQQLDVSVSDIKNGFYTEGNSEIGNKQMYEQWVEKEAQLESLKELENQLQEALELVGKAASKNEGKSEETKKKEERQEEKLLTNPTGKGIRNDSGGEGHFEAQRRDKKGNPRLHKGLDFSTIIGQNIVAPFSGNVINRIGDDTKAPLVDIWPTRRHPEFDFLQILYVDKPEEIQWKVSRYVEVGGVIGTAANLQDLGYSSRVGPHVHVQLWRKDNTRIDPTPFFFKKEK
jgi:ankyrin repeat protein